MPFHDSLEKFQCCLTISTLGNKSFKDFTFMANSSPQIIDIKGNFYRRSFPLNRAWWFGCNVVNNSIDSAYFVDDSVGRSTQKFMLEGESGSEYVVS